MSRTVFGPRPTKEQMRTGQLRGRITRRIANRHVMNDDWAEREYIAVLVAEARQEHEADDYDDLLSVIERDGCLRPAEPESTSSDEFHRERNYWAAYGQRQIKEDERIERVRSRRFIVSDEQAEIWKVYQEHCEIVRRYGL